MSLQRRLLLYLLISAPLVWAIAVGFSTFQARHEVNELFDTEMIRLARQVQDIAGHLDPASVAAQPLNPPPTTLGEADLNDFAVAIWNANGELLVDDHEGAQLPWNRDATGFLDTTIGDASWRIYYLQAPELQGLVAAGQKTGERDELVWGLVSSQMIPWLVVLPVLLLAMAWAVRQAMAPMHAVTESLNGRSAHALERLALANAPQELHPLLQAMNSLFERIETTLERERRFTADAAHELRTPIAVLSAQWAVYRGAQSDEERQRAAVQLELGLARASRLIEQLLSLSRLEATPTLVQRQALPWADLVEQAMSDVLPLAERRDIELSVEWDGHTADGAHAVPPWRGDAALMALLLRNLMDNAVRYAQAGSTVTLRLDGQGVAVENLASPVDPDEVAQWGKRFYRPEGQQESGSGLGVSIATRIATLHGLALHYRVDAQGHVVAHLSSA
jgi:two-component system, OmpR family, sensor histidine kinase QseC